MRFEPLRRPAPPKPEPEPEYVTTFYYCGDPDAEQYGVTTNHPSVGGLLLDAAAYFATLVGKDTADHVAGWLEHVTLLAVKLRGKGDPLHAWEWGVNRPYEFDEPPLPEPRGHGYTDPRHVDGYVVDGVPTY